MFERIQNHLNNAEWDLAEEIVGSLEQTHDLDNDSRTQLKIYQIQLYLETKQLRLAEKLVNQLINSIADWPKSVQIQILHVASQFALANKNTSLLGIYSAKFDTIYDSMSSTMQESNKAYYADLLDIQGQILFAEQQYNQSMTLFENAVSLQKKLKRPLQMAISMFHAGKVANVLQLPNRAEVFLEDSYRIFKELKYLDGQLSVAQSFIDTYQLKGDHQSVRTFEVISNELNDKLKLHELSRKKKSESDDLKIENDELKQKLLDSQIRLERKELEIDELHLQISGLQQKVDDFKDIKVVYGNLKEEIRSLETRIAEQLETIQDQSDLIRSQHKQLIELKSTKVEEPKIESSLDELVASSRLMENIYSRLSEVNTIKARILAMQLHISTSKCIAALRELEGIGAIDVDSWDSKSPMITLLTHL